MPFKEKAIVRHRLRPDWGAGRVLMRNDEYLSIDFTDGGLKKLKTSIADDHLEPATDEEIKALKPPKVKAVRTKVTDEAKAAAKLGDAKPLGKAPDTKLGKAADTKLGKTADAKPVGKIADLKPAGRIAEAIPAAKAAPKPATKPATKAATKPATKPAAKIAVAKGNAKKLVGKKRA